MDFIENGANAVSSLNMRSSPGDTTLAYKFLRMSTLHIMCSGKIPWIPQAENMFAAVATKHSAPECASQCLHRRTYNRLPAVQVFIPTTCASNQSPASQKCPRGQPRRLGGHALGARYTAFSVIPGNGVYRVRRRRFEEARSDSIKRRFYHRWRLLHWRHHQWSLPTSAW